MITKKLIFYAGKNIFLSQFFVCFCLSVLFCLIVVFCLNIETYTHFLVGFCLNFLLSCLFFVFVSIFFFCLNSLFACCNYFARAIAMANDEKHALPDFQFHEVCVCVWVGGILHYTIINFNRNSSRGFRINRFFKSIC